MRASTSYKRPTSTIPYILSTNSPSILVGVAQNMTDHKKVEQLEKFKKKVEQAAHDIRSPLLTLYMALNHCCKTLTEEEYMLLKNLTNNIKKITQELLDRSKKEKSADHQYIQVSHALAEIVKQKEIQYIDKNVSFKYSFDPALKFTFIHGNALNFERMMSNLINNSVEAFDGKQGTVKVSFSVNNGNVEIIVEDNGKGMPQETVNKLMRGESVSTTKVYGHGIGTQQIQEALQGLNGTQLVESALNFGTKITLTIPKSESQECATKQILEEKEDNKLPTAKNVADIVILDDSKSLVEAISAFLQSNGIKKVDTYCHPKDLLQNLSKYSVNTKIFMDNDFKSDISGEDLARELAAQGFKNIYILSGSPTKDLRSKYPECTKFMEKGAETFADDFIRYATRSGTLKKGTV